jgi:hypothetical protein
MIFNDEVDTILGSVAKEKGYDGGKGQLYSITKNLPHPLGEIVYKVVRYNQTHDPLDLVKIAAWARLIYEDAVLPKK